MHIAVCIKQVPDTKNVRIDPDTHTLVRQGVESIINPFDLFAVEAALKIKDETQARITVLTMGPPQADEALRDVLSRGVDDAVLLSDRAFAGADTWATSTTLAAAIRKLGDVDLILCGKQAVDGDTAQVGPEMATLLDVPYATFVKKIQMLDGGDLKIFRQTDEGVEIWKMPTPSLLTVIKEVGEPRLPSLRHKMRAKKAEIPVWGAADMGLPPESVGLSGSFTQVVRVFSPPRRTDRVLIQGTIEEQAEQLYRHLKEAKVPGL
ncbi:electron transfer flavoprotein subunit beta/FixA family protein [Desulforhabdus amnigena]|uniref:Electron transfer flavoprotein subunit beta n=1 Tax=Desulforhabdus amnigena TaxID=40218 RepID=A0A9W6FR40_9BACT|nr:electron transfer flavoprotein subunit beta/FixA family protein [Desulforhabdus amnigena]NLJ28830.1 electron transfer flavoprotein subunit beta/FixA family protein [Deltaproteobacteria bacterium]GLI33152.1 electron transfer flavoprotein subunit beta [Desulforhabdus amnigena]